MIWRYIIALLFTCFFANSQNTIDSLKKLLAYAKTDTTKLKLLAQLSDVCSEDDINKYTNPGIEIGNKLFANFNNNQIEILDKENLGNISKKQKHNLLKYYTNLLNNQGVYALTKGNNLDAIKLYEKALKIDTYLNDSGRIANTLVNIGSNYYLIGDNKKSRQAFSEGLKICQKNNDIKGLAACYNGLSITYRVEGNLSKCVDFALKSLKINEERKDSAELANLYSTIGTYYIDFEDYSRALEYSNKSIAISKAIKFKRAEATAYNNIGYIYKKQNKLDESLKYVLLSLKINQESGDKNQIVESLNNIGVLYKDLKKYSKALQCYNDALNLAIQINAQNDVANSYNKLAEINLILNNVDNALIYGNKAYNICKESNSISDLLNATDVLREAHKKKNNYKEALEFTNLYIKLKDSLSTKDLKSQILQKQYKYDYDKKVLTDSIKNIEQKKIASEKIAYQTKEIKQQKIIKYILFAGIFIITGFLIFIFNRLRITSQQKIIIENQNKELEIKNQNINESIEAAQKIQSVIFPSESELKNVFKNYILLFKPFDKLSGDFIWMNSSAERTVLIIGDCTGHGIPGSLLTLFANEFLNRIVVEKQITKPNLVLSEVAVEMFNYNSRKQNNQATVREGVDLAICLIDKKNNTISFSGSKTNIYIVNKQKQLQVLELNKFEVYKNENINSINLKTFSFDEINAVYITTDGFKDQLKYKSNRHKFGINKFNQFINENSLMSTEEQQKNLNELFTLAIQNHPQLDDITVFGFNII